MTLALLAGLGAAIAGAVVWGLIAYVTKHQFSLVAVVIGVAVGYAVHKFRPGNAAAAVASAVLALFGCALGAFLALVFAALGAGIGLGAILGHLNVLMHAYPSSLGAFGAFFWLVAAFLAFRTALSGPRGRQPRRVPRGRPAGYDPAGQPPYGQPAPGQNGPVQPTFGAPAPGQPEPGQPGTADGPGFALPQDPPARRPDSTDS